MMFGGLRCPITVSSFIIILGAAGCEKTNGDRDYKSEHMIRIFNRTSRSYQVVDGEGRSSVDHSEYFVYVTKEAWSCHPEGDTSKGFMRTVSEMVGFREIFEIKYYDGIEVTNTYNYEGKTSAKVREIRYSKPEAPTKALRYDGSLVFPNSDDNNKLDYSIAGCFREEGINPLPFEFRPACAVKEEFKRIATKSEEEFIRVSQITKQDLAKFFVPILEEVWNCKTIEVVHEMVGRRPIRRIDSYEGVNNIISIKNNEDKLTVRFREVKYLDPITKEMLRYRGTVRLVQPRIPKPPPTEHGVHYKLNPNRLYRALISPKGYDLRIGSRWEAKIGNVTDTVECELDENYDYAKSYGTKFRIRVKLVNETFNTITYKTEYVKSFKKSEYYDYVDKEFRICHTRFWKLQFLRVVNIIDILVPVHEIEFYNGVRIFENILTPDKKSVRIEETKFLDPDNLEVVKFEGTVNIKGAPTISGKLTSGIEIIPSDADIFWRVGHFSAEKTTVRELKFNDPPIIPDLKVDEGKPIRFGLTYERDSDYYHADRTVVCERCKSNFNLNDPETRSMVNFVKQGGMAQWVDEREMTFAQSKKYFKTIRYEEWTCKNPSQLELLGDVNSNNWCERCKSNFNLNDPETRSMVNFVKQGGMAQWVDEREMTFAQSKKYFKTIRYEEWTCKNPSQDLVFTRLFLEYYYEKKNLNAGDPSIGTIVSTGVTIPVNAHVVFDETQKYIVEFDDIMYFWREKRNGRDGIFRKRYEGELALDETVAAVEKFSGTEKFENENERLTSISATHSCNQINSGTGKDRRSFLRVVNQFSIKPYQCDVVGKLYHRDGVKVMTGEYTHGTAGCVEIAEVKFIDPRDYSVLKFDGKIQLFKDGIAVPKEITALRADRVSYLPLPDSDKLMKTILKDKGLTIEVGSPHEEILNINHVK
ncbi:hypothetical protein LSTR_LSTR009271 [Laodelphax striatellus]|uniref:Uncharacterized protein n=1 Tax=Laodelphax striatellus TaxID=195883 RepID=A0A482X599_LAOST|nr:hypothetical protein LSTR_LSTR009271 [Laodelphax striatellus]